MLVSSAPPQIWTDEQKAIPPGHLPLPHHYVWRRTWQVVTRAFKTKIVDGGTCRAVFQELYPDDVAFLESADLLADALQKIERTSHPGVYTETIPFLQDLVLEMPLLFPQPVLAILAAGSNHVRIAVLNAWLIPTHSSYHYRQYT